MPTYDYVCDACGHAFELFQSITAKPERTCPTCRKRKLRRLIGTGAAILVGGRAPSPDAAAEARSEATESSAKDSDAKAESSPSEKEAGSTEKNISGSTSTPTHEAREGRGVGNLVDAARRQRKESEASRSVDRPKKKKSDPKPVKGGSKSTPSAKNPKSSKSPKTSKTSKKNRSRGNS